MTLPAPDATIRLASRRGRLILATVALGSGMVFLDGTIVNVAVDRIGRDFHAGFSELQWVLNAYLLALAGLMLLGGALSDRFGRRRIFLLGAVWFGSCSLLCAVAPDATTLLVARGLQGVGGALLTPGSLAIISATFGAADRTAAVGAWSGLAGVGGALGPLLGGWLVQYASWRWAFALNVPLAAAVFVIGRRAVPESRADDTDGDAGPRRLDVVGAATGTLALGCLTLGATHAGSAGWSAETIGITGAGVAAFAVFLVIERLRTDPLVPLRMFRDRTLGGANLMTLLTYAALGAIMFVLVLDLQVSAGYTALRAGLALLPFTMVLLVLSRRSGALASRVGVRVPLTVGPLCAAAGALLLTRVDLAHHAYVTRVLPGVLLLALGMTLLIPPLVTAAMTRAPRGDVGIASAVNNAVARAGNLLAVAILPPLAGLRGDRYRNPGVMSHGYRIVMLSCCGLLICAALIVVAFGVGAAERDDGRPELAP